MLDTVGGKALVQILGVDWIVSPWTHLSWLMVFSILGPLVRLGHVGIPLAVVNEERWVPLGDESVG